MKPKYIINWVLSVLLSGVFLGYLVGLGDFQGLFVELGIVETQISSLFVLATFIIPPIFIYILYGSKKYDISETVKKGPGVYRKFWLLAVFVSVVFSVAIVLLSSEYETEDLTAVIMIPVLYASIFSPIWFKALTLIGQKKISKGALVYYPD
jgi:hypothetical protein